ncbi:4Fe-4S dicluster domain-containing protein [Clostridium carnis]
MLLQEVKSLFKEMGIVGAGGAGFPTYAKLSYDVETVILNGAECEPLFRVDRNLLKENTLQVLKGLDFVVNTLGAKEGIVAIKEHYKEADIAIDENIYKFPKLRKKLLKDRYPAGDEVVLVYETTKKIVPQGGIPLNVGVMVINVETIFNVYNSIEKNIPVTHKYITVGGAVNSPKTLCVPIGTTFKDLLYEVNGTLIEDYKLLIGGPMTGRIGSIDESVTKTTKGIFILPKDNPIIELREYKLNVAIKRAMGVCSQCRMCTDLCPRYLLGHSIEPHKIMNSLSFGLENNSKVFINALACCECNLCSSYSCHQNLNPKAVISDLKTRLRKSGVKLQDTSRKSVDKNREYRGVPVKRIVSRLKLSEYDKDAPISSLKKEPNIVNISTRQSIGALAKIIVKVGDIVKKNDVIGIVNEKDLGVYLHSSIDGVIAEVNENNIVIRREK